MSYAKIGMKAKTDESRVFEMEYSSLKRRILTVSGRVIPGKVRALTNMSLFGVYLKPNPENTVGVFDLRPFYAMLLNSQLLAKSKVFENYVLFTPEYEP